MEPRELSIGEAAELIERQELSPTELIESVLDRIEAVEPSVRAYEEVFLASAREAGRRAEAEVMAGGYCGPLHGIPIAVKDLFAIRGAATTGSSEALAENVPGFDSAVVERLRQAGAIPIGRTRTHEFAMGMTCPPVRNPHDHERIPGGSSGGSAVAVSASECLGAIGSDTGGSIRIPSALCGVVGIKPTYGLVSRFGMLPLSWSLDHAGPIGRNVEDVAILLGAIAGHDPRDPTTLERPGRSFRGRLGASLRGVRLGVPTNVFWRPMDEAVESSVREAIGRLGEGGAELREVEVPMADLYGAVGWAIALSESAAYHRANLRAHGDLLGDELRELLEIGQLVPAVDYIRALQAREEIKRSWRELFDREGLAAIVCPTLPATAPLVDQEVFTWADGSTEDLQAAFGRTSMPADLTGLPALSVPCGADEAGLPIGLQVIGRPLSEPIVFGIGHSYERIAA
jgi:aspartyl-tRNA(Asn)/glutamyl-tRNA(Gln) amidotransferase subunit A